MVYEKKTLEGRPSQSMLQHAAACYSEAVERLKSGTKSHLDDTPDLQETGRCIPSGYMMVI